MLNDIDNIWLKDDAPIYGIIPTRRHQSPFVGDCLYSVVSSNMVGKNIELPMSIDKFQL